MESEQGLSVRVLFAGACQGNFNKLLKKVEKVHDKNGPFDVLFCVGSFFSDEGDSRNAPDGVDIEFMQFLDSNKKMPMKTYVLGAYGHGSALAKKKMDEADSNIHCLGKSGILEMPNGLVVAFLEGIYNAEHFDKEPTDSRYYTKHEVESLKQTIQKRGGEVDFFLSCEWPENITNKLPEGSLEGFGELPKGSPHVSSLLGVSRPRYHFTSQPPLFFSRAPYKNPDLGAGSHVTRFASLCPFGSMTKQNLFALCLTPAQYMTSEKLGEIPPESTESPFDLTDRRKRTVAAQVRIEASADDSSCTPHVEGVAHQPQSSLGQDILMQSIAANALQQSPAGAFNVQQSGPFQPAGDNLGTGIQTLLHNIGRGNALSGPLHNPNSLQADGSLGTMGLQPTLMYSSGNGSALPYPFMGTMPVGGNLQPYQMSVNNPSSFPHGQINAGTGAVNLQESWASIAQNPQLFNAAVSMGLIQIPNQGIPALPIQSKDLLANALANLGLPNQAFQQGIPNVPKTDVDTETASESVVSDRRTPSALDIERNQAPSPQSKRYKIGSMEDGQVVRDRRKTCYVGQLPLKATREEVAQYFSQAGEVVHVLKRQGEGNDANWAFVQFATQMERDRAIQMLDQTLFGNQTIIVKPAKQELEFDPNEPVMECWFCLGSPSSDKALIVSVGKESYLAIDKGPIRDDHVLIVPTHHYPNTLKMSQGCYEEMQLYLTGLREMFASQGRFLLAFERYLQIPRLHGNHTHLSVVSIDETAANNAKETFIQRGRMQEGEWTYLHPNEATREAVHDLVGDEEYILVILPDGSKLVRPMFKKTRLPVPFGRDVMAMLAGIPERADWKLCLSSESEEKLKVERFKTQFTAFDYPNQS